MSFMDLEFSHCSASWSYSSFNDFRRRLAAAAHLRWPSTRRGLAVTPWTESSDPVVIVLKRSDSDDHIPYRCCFASAHYLEELMLFWQPNDFDRMNGTELVTGLYRAPKATQSLLFR
jgi:hypothetical protein